jgi:hypothetical protein
MFEGGMKADEVYMEGNRRVMEEETCKDGTEGLPEDL